VGNGAWALTGATIMVMTARIAINLKSFEYMMSFPPIAVEQISLLVFLHNRGLGIGLVSLWGTGGVWFMVNVSANQAGWNTSLLGEKSEKPVKLV
jgi:hypothetical protein